METTRLKYLMILVLIAATCAVYGQVAQFGFIALDDYKYVAENPLLARGLSVPGITLAFTSVYQGTWIPLTWLSFLMDYDLYGLNAGGYHVTNLFLHLLNTVLLFLFLVILEKMER